MSAKRSIVSWPINELPPRSEFPAFAKALEGVDVVWAVDVAVWRHQLVFGGAVLEAIAQRVSMTAGHREGVRREDAAFCSARTVRNPTRSRARL